MPETDCDSLLFFALFMSLVGNLYKYFYPIKHTTGNVDKESLNKDTPYSTNFTNL